MSSSNGHGFREVLVDQPFAGKWMEVDMNLGGGHSTFQGTKFSDFAGGYSYKNGSAGKPIVQNRCIYWRTLNDSLELTELSMDYNLLDNQVRYIFQDSPIVGPITIQETDNTLVILVATVTSVNRFIFTHPKRVNEMPMEKSTFSGNNKPSIFYQICNKPQMNFRSFNLYEHAINIPVPLSAACYFVERGPSYNQNFQLNSSALHGECLFAFSFESGSIHVYKISREETLIMYDLRQANMFARFFSGLTTSILRSSNSSTDAVIGLSFFSSKADRGRSVQLVTLSMNGQLSLWSCNNIDVFTEWTSYHSGVVNTQFAINGFTDSSMLLRKNQDQDPNELPFFVIYIPEEGFKIYNVLKNVNATHGNTGGNSAIQTKFILHTESEINFKERELMDFTVTSEYIFVLVNNPAEETEWEIKSYNLNELLNPRFNLALLEPLPNPDVPMFPSSAEPKEFYMDLVFNKSSFSSQTITKALTMFRKEEDESIKDKDWESLRITAMNVIDREISLATSNSDFDISDDEYTELSSRFWLMFYNSCVEYHIHTVKPLGLFFESNSKMVCVVKKSRISFLRPTDSLETMYFFPHCLSLADNEDIGDDHRFEQQLMLKYLEVIDIIESTVEEKLKLKLEKRLRESHFSLEEACTEVANYLTESDPTIFQLEHRHLIPLLGSKLKDLGEHGDLAMRLTIRLITTWDEEGDNLNHSEDDEMENLGSPVSEYFMGSRVGAHLTFRILKQLMQNRFMIARDTMLLHSLIINYFSQNNDIEGIHMLTPWDVRDAAFSATTNYYALLQLAEDSMEFVRPYIKERGLKIANILKLFTADHLAKSEDYMDPLWPMKVIESFCVSQIGGLAIRSRVSTAKRSTVLGFVEAAGRSLWTNDMNVIDHPFEDFLITSCQYTLLLKYANYMITYFTNSKTPMRKFYLGVANLCLEEPDVALSNFRSISLQEAADDQHFCQKVLEIPMGDLDRGIPPSAHTSFFVKIITLFQIFELIPAVQRLAEDGLDVAENDNSATRMCSLAFKSALSLDDFRSAYKYILKMPSNDVTDPRQERKEKLASLRMFVSKILSQGEVEVLITLDFSDMFNKTSSVRDQVEQILFAQANLSDPLAEDGVYQMLYSYHLCRENFHKAAATMYYRAMRLGEKGKGLEALEAQKNSYMDVITCLSLVENKNYRFVIQKTGIVPETPEPETCFDGSEVPVFSDEESMIVRKYSDVSRELQLCVMLCKIADKFPPTPIKTFEFARRAEKAIECLIINHCYDDAIKLSTLWNISVLPVISTFSDVCCHLVYNILPESGDPSEYIRNNDVSELPNSSSGVIEIAFRLLQNYLLKLEKPMDSILHEQVALKFLAADIELPQWLIASYKKRNTAQLLRCFIRYGDWGNATDLAVKVLDATLGRRKAEEFDPSIKKITAYDPVEPVIPFSDINLLAGQMKARFQEEPALEELYNLVKERANLFCARVKECSREREMLFSQRLQF